MHTFINDPSQFVWVGLVVAFVAAFAFFMAVCAVIFASVRLDAEEEMKANVVTLWVARVATPLLALTAGGFIVIDARVELWIVWPALCGVLGVILTYLVAMITRPWFRASAAPSVIFAPSEDVGRTRSQRLLDADEAYKIARDGERLVALTNDDLTALRNAGFGTKVHTKSNAVLVLRPLSEQERSMS